VNYTIQFSEQELAFVLNVLGDLPTKSNAFIVMTSINEQIKAQQAPVEETAE
jgi:hypothetical protein